MSRRVAWVLLSTGIAIGWLGSSALSTTAQAFVITDQFPLSVNPGKQWGEWPMRRGKARIAYATRSKALRPSLRVAAKAWSGSGANVAFREVPWKRAKLRVYARRKALHGHDCGVAKTPVKFKVDRRTGRLRSPGAIAHGKIFISTRCGGSDLAEDEIMEQWLLAHELGHALGLGHELRRCSIMGPALPTNRRSPFNCPELTGKWFCGLISRDDAAGARWLYGGRRRDPTRHCLLYPELARLPTRIAVSVTGSSYAMDEDDSESWSWSVRAMLIRRGGLTNTSSLVYEVESGEGAWTAGGKGGEWDLAPHIRDDPSVSESLRCSYAGTTRAPLEAGSAALTIDVEPSPHLYDAWAYQFVDVPVTGECAAGEFEGPRPLSQGLVQAPDWLVTGPQRGDIYGGLRGSQALEPGDPNSSGGSVSWEMTALG